MNVGVILSGGTGTRFGAGAPKQYLDLNGRKVIEYSLDAFYDSKLMDKYFIVMAQEHCANCPFTAPPEIPLIPGGGTRNESFMAAIDYISQNLPDCNKVIVHEAARPFLTGNIIDDYFSLLDEYDAVVTTKKITSSLGAIDNWFVDREKYFLIQAPEAFRFPVLRQCFQSSSETTAAVQQLPKDSKIYGYQSFRNNIKITYPEDLIIAGALMEAHK